MNEFRTSVRWDDRWALGWIALLTVVPFLHAHHRNPIPSFFPEWWAILFGLLASLAFLSRGFLRDLRIPRIVVLPLSLALVIGLQIPLLSNIITDVSLNGILFLLWAALLMMLSATLVARVGVEIIFTTLTAGLAIGAAGSVVTMALQASYALTWTGLISVSPLERLFGNLNQPNHLALQLWLGISSVLYLRAQNQIRLAIALCALATFAIASLFTGSRAIVFYSVALPMVVWLMRRRLPAVTSKEMFRLGLLTLLITLAGQTLQQIAPTTVSGAREWSVAPGSSDGIRLGLWWTASQLGWDHWWSGIGWGRFASTSFTHMEALSASAPMTTTLTPGEHAHNILFNLWAETGFWGPVLLVVCLLGWLWRVGRGDPAGQFVWLLLLPIALHAQLEYTLWYAFFLAPAALMLGAADSSWRPPKAPSLPLAGVVLLAALTLAISMRQDYTRLERAMHWPGGDAAGQSWDSIKDELLALRQNSRFGSYVDLSFAATLALDRDRIEDKRRVCLAAIRFSPTDYTVFKCAAIDALAGDSIAAKRRLARAMLAYPDQTQQHLKLWRTMLTDHPELAPLVQQMDEFLARRAAVGHPAVT